MRLVLSLRLGLWNLLRHGQPVKKHPALAYFRLAYTRAACQDTATGLQRSAASNSVHAVHSIE